MGHTDNISVMTMALIYVVGIYSIAQGITVGVLIAFVSYIWRFWLPITNLSNFYNSIITSMAYLERIFETIDEKPAVIDKENAIAIPEITGNIEFKDVCLVMKKIKISK